ncbi:MAG: alpha/beta fold hydrolase [Pseudomonadales bacterium]|nr:alpha/beta fold hydrolase [Pseudomonadales bacterium]
MKQLANKLTSVFLVCALLTPSAARAEGEAGPINLRGQGHFYVGLKVSEPAENGAVQVKNQMFVGYQLAAERRHPYPLILIHGGGGQSTDWFSTPDGRDGWRDYFLAAGFDVYWIDRPGYGRSPTNPAYGELSGSANSGIISFLATSEHWPGGDPRNHRDPNILAWLASSPPGPYAGNEIAAADLALLLERVGPAILITHSAGAVTGWWGADANPAKVAGIIAIEPGASNITSAIRSGLTFTPPLPADFAAQADADGCELQAPGKISKLSTYAHIPVKLVGSELGLISGLPCAVKAFTQAGVKVDYTYLPDLGLKGNGHFMMAETNNGDIAQVIIKLAAGIK